MDRKQLRFLTIFLLLSLAATETQASSFLKAAKSVWRVFSKSPLPKILEDLFQIGKWLIKDVLIEMVKQAAISTAEDFVINILSNNNVTVNISLFFFDTDLSAGKQMSLAGFSNSSVKATFLPEKDANSIPFSSDKFSEILDHFKVEPNSTEASIMKQTLETCEKALKGQENRCFQTLDLLLNYTATKLREEIKPLTSEIEKEPGNYGNLSIADMGVVTLVEEAMSILCHKMKYPYAVFLCLPIELATMFSVSFVGDDGGKVKALAVCQRKTSAVFQVLEEMTGSTVPNCYFLDKETLVFLPGSDAVDGAPAPSPYIPEAPVPTPAPVPVPALALSPDVDNASPGPSSSAERTSGVMNQMQVLVLVYVFSLVFLLIG